MTAEVNIIISIHEDEFVYETVKPIAPGMEIVMCQYAPFWLPPASHSMFTRMSSDLSTANKKSPNHKEFTPPAAPEYTVKPSSYNPQLPWMENSISNPNCSMIDHSSEIFRVSNRWLPRHQVSSQSSTHPTTLTSSQSPSRHKDFIHCPLIPTKPSQLPSTLTTPGQSSPVEPKPKKAKARNLACSFCEKLFDRESALVRHTRVHTDEKPYICSVCDKAFSTTSSLNTHKGIHTGEKPHKCPTCGKGFTATSNLYYHKMTHIRDKPHKCSVCTKSFPTPGDLKSHIYKHTGKYPHNCTICGKGFAKAISYKVHARKH